MKHDYDTAPAHLKDRFDEWIGGIAISVIVTVTLLGVLTWWLL